MRNLVEELDKGKRNRMWFFFINTLYIMCVSVNTYLFIAFYFFLFLSKLSSRLWSSFDEESLAATDLYILYRVSSAEAEGNDGVFCTSDSINVLDFRQPSGIALKIPKVGVDVQSAFSRGDSIYIGCSTLTSAAKKQYSSQIQQFSLRKQRLFSTYMLPESNAHSSFTALTQVWGSSNYVMGVSGLGLFVFDSLKDDGLPSYTMDYNSSQNVKEIIGQDDMYYPSFDYLSSRVLLISKDRPAQWRYLF